MVPSPQSESNPSPFADEWSPWNENKNYDIQKNKNKMIIIQ